MSLVQKNIIVNFIGKGWSGLISIAFVPIYIKYMGIEAYGLVGIYISLLTLFALLDLGLSTTLNRELATMSVLDGKAQDMRDLLRTLESIYWAVALMIGASVLLLASYIANHWVNANNLSADTIYQAITIMGFSIAFQWPFSLYSGGLMGLQLQVLLNGITATMVTVRAVGAVIVLSQISPTIQAFFLWQIFASLLQTMLTGIFLWFRLPKSNSPARFRKNLLFGVWHFAAGMTGISVMGVILTQMDKIILSKLLTLEMFGYYSLASMVAIGLNYFVVPIFTGLFPRFSQLVALNQGEQLKQLYHRSCQLMSVILLPTTMVVAFFATEILFVWTKDATIAQNTHLILSLLIIGTGLNGLMNIPYALQLANGWTKLSFYLNLVAVILLVPLVCIMAIRYAAVGAATVWIILNSGYVMIGLQIMHRKLLKGEQWRWYLHDVCLPLSAALVIVLIGRMVAPENMSKMMMVVYIILVFMMTQFASLIVTPFTRFWISDRLIKLKKVRRQLLSMHR